MASTSEGARRTPYIRRTIVIGKGKSKRVIHVAVVRKQRKDKRNGTV